MSSTLEEAEQALDKGYISKEEFAHISLREGAITAEEYNGIVRDPSKQVLDTSGIPDAISQALSYNPGQQNPNGLPGNDPSIPLQWTPPPRETTIRSSAPGGVYPPEMQPNPSDVMSMMSQVSPQDMAAAQQAFVQTPRTRSDLGVFRGGAARMGQETGYPILGQLVEDAANPLSIAEGALIGPLLSPLGRMASPFLQQGINALGRAGATRVGPMSGIAFESILPKPGEVIKNAIQTAARSSETPIGQVAAGTSEPSPALTAFDKYLKTLTRSASEAKPVMFSVKGTVTIPEEEIVKRATTALKAAAPNIHPEEALDMVVEKMIEGQKRPAQRAINELKSNLRMALGRGDRIATNMVRNITGQVVPDNIAAFIRGVEPNADVPLVLSSLADQVGSQFIGRPVKDAATRVQAMQAISKAIEESGSGNSLLKQAVKEYVENFGFVKDTAKSKLHQYAPINPKIKALSEAGALKDISKESTAVTDMERLGAEMDSGGIVSTELHRPLMVGEVNYLSATEKFAVDWVARFPGIKPKSNESATLQRFLEGRLSQGDVVTPDMKIAAREMRNAYNTYLTRVNEVRLAIGKKPIPFRTDFSTHFKELGLIDEFMGLINASEDDLIKAAGFAHPTSPFFKSALQRTGGDFQDDAITGLMTYVSGANKVIHMTKPIASIRTNMGLLPPNAGKAFTSFADEASGKSVFAGSVFETADTHPAVLFMEKLSNRYVANLISGNMGTVIKQAGSLPFIYAQVGEKHFGAAAVDLLDPAKRAFAQKMSVAVRSRMHSSSELVTKSGMGDILDAPLQFADENISMMAFFGGLRKAKDLGMTGRLAVQFADSVANRSNVIYLRSNTPLILRTHLVRTFAPIQTFTFNAMNFLFRDIGKKLSRVSQKEALGMAARFAGGALALDGIYVAADSMLGTKIGPPVTPWDFFPMARTVRSGFFGAPGEVVRASQNMDKWSTWKRLIFRFGPKKGGLLLERLYETGSPLPMQKE